MTLSSWLAPFLEADRYFAAGGSPSTVDFEDQATTIVPDRPPLTGLATVYLPLSAEIVDPWPLFSSEITVAGRSPVTTLSGESG